MLKTNNACNSVFLFEIINAGIAAGAVACAGATPGSIVTSGLLGAGAATAGAFLLGSLGLLIDVVNQMSENQPEDVKKEEKQSLAPAATLIGGLIGSVGVGAVGFFAVTAAPIIQQGIKEFIATP